LSLSIHVVSYIKIAAYPKNIMYIERMQYCDIPPSDIKPGKQINIDSCTIYDNGAIAKK